MIKKTGRSCRPAGPAAAHAFRAGRAPSFACESLEARQLLSSFVYSDMAGLVGGLEARGLTEGYYGPVAVLGDIDGDGVTDLLVGNASARQSSGAEIVESGAAVVSGKTGGLIRAHGLQDSFRYGWSVAALGDINADGVPDYGIGTGGPEGDPVAFAYSGATGAVLFTFGTPVTGRPGVAGTTIAGAGDINGDGKPDILVSFMQEGRTVAYSGVDGSAIREFTGEGAMALAGGVDLDGDATPDFVSATLEFVTAYSGQTGAQLWRINQPDAGPIPAVHLDLSGDFNGDGRADPLITTADYFVVDGIGRVQNRARVYSGVDGDELLFIAGPAETGLSGGAAAIPDQNGDGKPEIAATVGLGGAAFPGAENGLFIYSGSDGHVVATLRDTGAATLTPAPTTGGGASVRMGITGSAVAADLNGDGFAEVITTAQRIPPAAAQELVSSRVIAFDGAMLGNPVFEGANAGDEGDLIGWGRIGATSFVFLDGRATPITALGYVAGDRVLGVDLQDNGVLIVIERIADPEDVIAWYGVRGLESGFQAIIPDAIRNGGPEGDYVFDRVVDVEGGEVLVQMTRDGDTPTAWVLKFVVTRPPGSVRLDYAFDGVPTAIESGRVVGLSLEDPGVGMIWDATIGPILVPGFRPVDLQVVPDGTLAPPQQVLGVAQRDGDAFGRPYFYDTRLGEFTAIPLIEGGTEWNPVRMNVRGDVIGTYRTVEGDVSVFIIYAPSDSGLNGPVDVLGSTLLGAPDGVIGGSPTALGLMVADSAGPARVYVSYADSQTGQVRSAALDAVEPRGPFLSPTDAAFVVTQDGSALVTRNLAGELLVFLRQTGGSWAQVDLAFADPLTGEAIYGEQHFGGITTWHEPGFTSPHILLATEGGIILIEPVFRALGSPTGQVVEIYQARNLTTELAGSQAIVSSIITMRPLNDLQLVAGLTASGDLVLYGLNTPVSTSVGASTSWAYANLFDQVLRPVGAPEPQFRPGQFGDNVAYVTSWGGLNIAGVDQTTGDVVVFWTAPGLDGWQVANLDDSLVVPRSRTFGLSNLTVYLTDWGGINIVGGEALGVFWWAPGLGGNWRFDALTDVVKGRPMIEPSTLTAYVTPWGGLNVAGLDRQGQLWVYWWTPTTPWQVETIDAALSAAEQSVPRTGQLRSTVTPEGRIDIYARNPFGDPLDYSWTPGESWELNRIGAV